ncbi:hypothetical protein CMT75_18850 [Elizabethkingia anophelis]|nr:hypothetical protein [Elizabethkingia anophelis]
MKTLITIISLFSITLINAQFGDAAVVGTLNKIEVANKADRIKQIAELRNQVNEVRKQSQLIIDAKKALDHVSNGVLQMQLLKDIKDNSLRTVSAYTDAYSTLKRSKLSPSFVGLQMQKLENGLANNKKLIAFFSSVLQKDIFSMKDAERISLLQQINSKVITNLNSINSVNSDVVRQSQIDGITNTLSNFPTLK